MKNFAKLLMVPVAFVGLSTFSAAAAEYTLTDDPIIYGGDSAKGATVYADLKDEAYVDGDFKAADTGLTKKSFLTGEVIEIDCTDAEILAAAAGKRCSIAAVSSAEGSEAKAAALAEAKAAENYTTPKGKAIDVKTVTLEEQTDGATAILTIPAGSVIEVSKITAKVNTHVVIKGTLKGDLETAGDYKVIGGVYNTDTYKVTYSNPVGVPTGLTRTVKDGKVDLAWTEVYGADVYVVRRSEKGSSSCGTSYTTLSSSVSKNELLLSCS